jgi:hypothetical protein
VHTGPGPEIDHVIGGEDGRLVVLDDHDAIALVAQGEQAREQPVVVAGVQSDRGLVEDVEHTDQARADLRREADALCLAAGEGRGGPVETQIAEADPLQERDALAHLFEDPLGHPRLRGRELEGAEEGRELVERRGTELGQAAPAHTHAARFDAQPRALAVGTGPLALEARELRVGAPARLLDATREIAEHAVERTLDPGDAHPELRVARQKRAAHVRRQLLPRRVEVDAEGRGDLLEELSIEAARLAEIPRGDRAGGERERRVGHDALGIEVVLPAEAAAAGAGTEGIVEREQARRELGERDLAGRAGARMREPPRARGAVHHVDQGDVVREAQGRREGFAEPGSHALLHDDPIDDELDVVAGAAGEGDVFGEVAQDAVDAGAGEAVAEELGELLLVLALASAHDGREDLDPRPLRQREDSVDHLRDGLLGDRGAASPAMGGAGAGVEEPEVVGDLGDRADGAAGALADALLFDRDGRREALDRLDVGAGELVEVLAREGREALDITSLALGVERVEGEARLARAGRAGHDDELVAGDREVEVLQVVGAGTADFDLGRIAAGGEGGDRRVVPGEAGLAVLPREPTPNERIRFGAGRGLNHRRSPSSRCGSACAGRRST